MSFTETFEERFRAAQEQVAHKNNGPQQRETGARRTQIMTAQSQP